MKRFDGKVVFIAGASSGIGRVTAKKFAEEGATVVFCARREELVQALAQEIQSAGGKAEGFKLDVSDIDAYVAAIEAAASRHGQLDVLVHNAMAGGRKSFEETSPDDWAHYLHLNANSCLFANLAAIRLMKPRGRGAIVNIATIAGMRVVPGYAPYGASKATMIHLSKCLAEEHARAGIRVNVVSPGMIATETLHDAFDNDPAGEAAITNRIPVGRFGRPEELAAAVLFFASDDASYITGQVLLVDGGKGDQVFV